MAQKTLITNKQAMELAGISENTLNYIVRKGSVKKPKKGFIDRQSLEAWMNDKKAPGERYKMILASIREHWENNLKAPTILGLAWKHNLSTSVVHKIVHQLYKDDKIEIHENVIFLPGLRTNIEQAVSAFFKMGAK